MMPGHTWLDNCRRALGPRQLAVVPGSVMNEVKRSRVGLADLARLVTE